MKRNKKRQKHIPFLLLWFSAGLFAGSMLFSNLVSTAGSNVVSAITCPDGTFLPDERADECPNEDGATTTTPSGSRPGSLSNNCSTNPNTPECQNVTANQFEGNYQCGRGDGAVKTAINIGCRGERYPGEGYVNPILDMAFALLRVASAGVGLVIIGSIIVAGIQYTVSRGNPQMTEASIKRITSSIIALLIFIFTYAMANFLVPGGILFT